MGELSKATLELMRSAIRCPKTRTRYEALIHPTPLSTGCLLWTGAIAGRGHGRFWLGRSSDTGRNVAVVAHRWTYALHHSLDALLDAEVIRHNCDNPICQNPAHLSPGDTWQNTLEGLNRREIIGNPLRDIRGARGRALALRRSARIGSDLQETIEEGRPALDRYQEPLPTLDLADLGRLA